MTDVCDEHTPGPGRRPPSWLTALCLGLMLILHLGFLEHHSLRSNEFITLQSIQLSYPGLIQERLKQNHMPGFFLVVKAWTALAGTSQTALRLPPALCGVAGLLILWRLGCLLFGPWTGLAVLLLGALNQALVLTSMDARMYSWLFCATAGLLWMTVRYLEGGRARDGAGVALFSLFGVLGHNLFLVAPLCVLLFSLGAWRHYPRRWWRLAVLAWSPVLLLAPLLIYYLSVQTRVGGASAWHEFQTTTVLRQILTVSLGEYDIIGGKHWRNFSTAVLLLAIGVAAWQWARAAWRGARRAEPLPLVCRYTGLFLLVAFLPGMLIAAAQMRSETSMVGAWRYYIASAAAAPLLAGQALHALRRIGGGVLAWGLGLIIAAILTVNTAAFLRSPGSGLREVAADLRRAMQPGDQVIVSQEKNRSYAFIYYGVLDELPVARPLGLEANDEGARTIAGMIVAPRRFWAVFLEPPGEDVLARILHKYPDRFAPLGELTTHGETSVQLFAAPPQAE